MYIPNQAMF